MQLVEHHLEKKHIKGTVCMKKGPVSVETSFYSNPLSRSLAHSLRLACPFQGCALHDPVTQLQGPTTHPTTMGPSFQQVNLWWTHSSEPWYTPSHCDHDNEFLCSTWTHLSLCPLPCCLPGPSSHPVAGEVLPAWNLIYT